MDDTFITAAKRFHALCAERKRIEAELKTVMDELDSLQEPLTSMFVDAGVSKISVDDVTLYVARESVPSMIVPEGTPAEVVRLMIVHTLAKMGHESAINYNYSSVRSLLKELADEEGNIPEPLGSLMKLDTRHKVKALGVSAASTAAD